MIEGDCAALFAALNQPKIEGDCAALFAALNQPKMLLFFWCFWSIILNM